MGRRKRQWRVLSETGAIGMLVLCASGCVSQARMFRPTCQRVQPGGELEALAFSVTVETDGLLGQQLIYEVSLVNAAAKPIKSTDERYQNSVGAVAASKTLMVLESPSTFKDLPLSIPAEQLQIRKGDWPVMARFRLYDVDGTCLAQASCAVPPEKVERVAATRPAQGAAARAAATPKAGAASTPKAGAASTPRTGVGPTPKDRAAAAPSGARPTQPGTRQTTPQPSARPTTSQPATRPTRPQAAPPRQKSAPGERATPPGERAGAEGPVVPDVDVFARLDKSVAAAEKWAKNTWPSSEKGAAPTASAPARAAGPSSQPSGGVRGQAPSTRPSSQPTSDRTDKPAAKRRYVVQRGDSLTRIAQRVLGDAARWEEIYNLNRDQISAPDRISEGMQLWVPDEGPVEEDK